MKNYQSVGKQISMLNRYAQMYLDHELKKFDLSSGLVHIFAEILKNDGISQKKIVQDLKLDKSTVSKAIKKLEEKKYIEKKMNRNDKREYLLFYTLKAEKIRIDFFKILKSWTNILLKDFSKEKYQIFLKILDKSRTNALSHFLIKDIK